MKKHNKKNFSKHLLIALLTVICIAALSIPAFAALTDNTLMSVRLTVPTAPVAGNLPDTNVQTVNASGMYYVESVDWLKGYVTAEGYSFMSEGERFQYGGRYRIAITVRASEDSAFTANFVYAFIGDEKISGTVLSEKEALFTLDYTLEKCISSVVVNGLDAPKAGEYPDTAVSTATEGYTATVTWINQETGAEHPANQPFKAKITYTARVTLTAKNGYLFSALDSLKPYVNSIDRTGAVHYESSKSIVITSYFATTDYAPVSNLNVTLDTPLPGSHPDYTAEVTGDGYVADYDEDGYINGVMWVDYATGRVLTEEDTFVAGAYYFAFVYMRSDEDYSFANIANDAVKLCGKTPVLSEAPDTGSPTAKVGEIIVQAPYEMSELTVSALTAPKPGNTPDYSFYLGEGITAEDISWCIYVTDASGSHRLEAIDKNHVFRDGEIYVLTVKVKNENPNYVFGTVARNDGTRYVSMTTNLDGIGVSVVSWLKTGDRVNDPYYYAELTCWYDCKASVIDTVHAYLDTPVAGNIPDRTVTFSDPNLTATNVRWYKMIGSDLLELVADERFVRGIEYRVVITFQTDADSKLAYNSATGSYDVEGKINWKYAAVTNVGGSYETKAEIQGWLTCSDSYITDVDIGGVTAPVAGEKPDYDFDMLGDGFYTYGKATSGTIINGQWVELHYVKNGIYWYDLTAGKEVYENESFIGGHTYQLRISVYTSTDYHFTMDGDNNSLVDATVNGNAATVTPRGSYSPEYELYVYYEFECATKAIDSIYVEIGEPVVGESILWNQLKGETYYSVNSEGWTDADNAANGIVWANVTTNTTFKPFSAVTFEENTEYTVIIHLQIKEGYYIEDADSFYVYLNGIRTFDTMVFPYSGAILVIYRFPHTECFCELVEIEETLPTCTEGGLAAHYECEKCRQRYKDAEGSELLDEGEDWGYTPPLGHNFGSAYDRQSETTHINRCICGEMVEENCVFEPVLVMGPSMYSRYDGYLYTCIYCGNEGSFFVDQSQCDHALTEWAETEIGSGRHFRTCACEWGYEEEYCDYVMTVVKAPSEYSDVRDVALYTCKYCDGSYITPIETGSMETTDSVTDEFTGVIITVPDFSDALIPYDTIAVTIPLPGVSDDVMQNAKDATGEDVEFIGGYHLSMSCNGLDFTPYGTVTVYYDLGFDPAANEFVYVMQVVENGIIIVDSMYDYSEQLLYFDTDEMGDYIVVMSTNDTPPVECEHNYMDSYYCSICSQEMPKLAEESCDYTHDFVLWENGDLVITGEGFMDDFTSAYTPWFEYKNQIKRVLIEDGTTYIGAYAFSGCRNITEIRLPSTLLSIGEYAFNNNSSLTYLELPEKIVTIGKAAFRNCGIEFVSFMGSTNGWYAGGANISNAIADGTSAATAITTSYSTVVWVKEAAEDGSSIAGGYFAWELTDTGVLKLTGKGAMPDYNYDTMPWFDYKHMIVKIEIGSGITSIGRCAFYGCSALRSVSIPTTVTTIGEYAFYSCGSLTEIEIPAYVGKIGKFAFRRAGLTTVTFAKYYGWSAGENKFTATEVYGLGAGLLTKTYYKEDWVRDYYAAPEEINPNFVAGGACNSYTKWELSYIDDAKTQMKLVISGNGIMPEYGTGSAPWYEYLDQIVEIEITEGVTTVGRCAFYGLKMVTKVTLCEGIEKIGDYAFNGCKALTEIVIPTTVTSIGTGAFGKTGLAVIPTV